MYISGTSFLVMGAGLIAFLLFAGKNLITQKAAGRVRDAEPNIFEELSDLQSLKINNVPAKEFNSYVAGIVAFFLAYHIFLHIVMGIIGYVYMKCGFVKYDAGALLGLPVCVCLEGFWTAIAVAVFAWYYTFFTKAIAPNLKYGSIIIERIHKLAKKMMKVYAIIILGSALYIDPNGERILLGFASLLGPIPMFLYVKFVLESELFRAGIPDLWQGLQKLMKEKGHGIQLS